jgi:hypothetical protein
LKKEKDAAERADAEKQLKERRDFAQQFWKEKEREYHDDAHEIRRLRDEETARGRKQALDMDRAEQERRRKVRIQDQSEGPATSTNAALMSGKTLGIFGIPYADGEFASEHTGGNVPGVDDQTVDLFQKVQHTKYEEDRARYMDSEAEEGKQGDLYESLKAEIKQLDDELQNTQQLRSRLSTEMQQNQTEMDLVLKQQAGPPRRDPTPDERVTTHVRKNRARELAAELSKLSRVEQKISTALSLANAQSGKVAAKVASLRVTNNKLKGRPPPPPPTVRAIGAQ